MREQGIILEHDVDRPRSWRHMRHVDAVNFDYAFIDTLEPGQHPQQRGFATARGTKEAEQLTAFDIKGQVVDCHHIAKAARYFPDADEGCFGQLWQPAPGDRRQNRAPPDMRRRPSTQTGDGSFFVLCRRQPPAVKRDQTRVTARSRRVS